MADLADQRPEPERIRVALHAVQERVMDIANAINDVIGFKNEKAPGLTTAAQAGTTIIRPMLSAYVELVSHVNDFIDACTDSEATPSDAYLTVAFMVRGFAAEHLLGAIEDWMKFFGSPDLGAELRTVPSGDLYSLRGSLWSVVDNAELAVERLTDLVAHCAEAAGTKPDEVTGSLMAVVARLRLSRPSLGGLAWD